MDNNLERDKKLLGLGMEIGPVTLEDGSTVQAGKVFMPGQWDSESYAPLAKEPRPNDLCIYMNRLSGFWDGTDIENTLHTRGIRTVIFNGDSLGQYVASRLIDAVSKGWDYLLLSDGCFTTSPEFARKGIEANKGGWGFLLACQDLIDSVNSMHKSEQGASE